MTTMNAYREEVINDLRHGLSGHDCEINHASNLEIIKELVAEADKRYIEAGSKGLFKAEKLQAELFAFRNNIDEYESMYTEVVDTQFHFVQWPRPNGTMHLLNFDEAIHLLAADENFK